MISDALRATIVGIARRHGGPARGGRVLSIAAGTVLLAAPDAQIGDILEVRSENGPLPCEVVGFRGKDVIALPLRPFRAVAPGAEAWRRTATASFPVGDALLGRLLDPFGAPLDGEPAPRCVARVAIDNPALPIHLRSEVEARFDTGVRVIDGLLTCGRGQRVGIFAGAGCGKSVLVEQIASQSKADVVVVGLVGERGREVRELLGSARRHQTIAVAATADQPALERVRGAMAATAIAEHFRDRGANVLLVIDSLTRFAMALREIGLALGEPPATKGYPPSVFAAMPRLLERVSPSSTGGSITAFYTVLVEGDDLSDPIADSARSLLDAHIVLSREMAGRGHFPAIDVLASASRVARRVITPAAARLAEEARETLATRRTATELQALGAHVVGANPALDAALVAGERLDVWSRQAPYAQSTYAEATAELAAALGKEPLK
ncbi:MAG: FliI/YscN family ATPase [Deltaproteobacteria bacterium]|nr:FliI/YscN family ATPase [Deltaproteobacteria bacterium]